MLVGILLAPHNNTRYPYLRTVFSFSMIDLVFVLISSGKSSFLWLTTTLRTSDLGIRVFNFKQYPLQLKNLPPSTVEYLTDYCSRLNTVIFQKNSYSYNEYMN